MSVIPLSLVPLIVYIAASLLFAGASDGVGSPGAAPALWDNGLVTLNLVSGQSVTLSYGTGFVVAALLLLLIAVWRGAARKARSVAASLLAILAFGAHVVVFLTLGFAATPVFFLIMAVACVEALAAVSLSMAAGHKDGT